MNDAIQLPRQVVDGLSECIITAIQRLGSSPAPASRDGALELEASWLELVEAVARHDAQVCLWGPTLQRPEAEES